MSKLNVEIDYVKLAQYIAVIECYIDKLKKILDYAVLEKHAKTKEENK